MLDKPKAHRSYHCYTLSISADRKYKFIRKQVVSTARDHDTRHFEQVPDASNTSRYVCADKGCQERETRLK